MGETKNLHFYDSGIFERVPERPNQIFVSFETPGYLKQIKKHPSDIFERICCYQDFGKSIFCQFWKRWAPNNEEDPSKQFLNISDMRSICSRKHEMTIWYFFETKNSRNQETKKPRNKNKEPVFSPYRPLGPSRPPDPPSPHPRTALQHCNIATLKYQHFNIKP